MVFLGPAPGEQGPRFFYHATNLEAALKIQAEGFRVDLSGSNAGARLGPGVYCTVTLQKAMQYCKGPHGGIVFELQVDLGKCKKLERNDPLMTTWQQNGYDSAWAPAASGGSGLEENCIKDPGRIRIKQAFPGHTVNLERAGYHIVNGRITSIAAGNEVRPRCNVPGCSRDTWNGQPGEQCCRTCKSSGGAQHGPDCNRKHGQMRMSEPLPPNWTACQDPTTGRTYYQNFLTHVTQWERPVSGGDGATGGPHPAQLRQPATENQMRTGTGVISAEAAAGCYIGLAMGFPILSHESASGPDRLEECVFLPIPMHQSWVRESPDSTWFHTDDCDGRKNVLSANFQTESNCPACMIKIAPPRG